MSTEQDQAPRAERAATPESANHEAARWRRKFRDADAQREALIERVDTYQRGEIEMRIGEHLNQPDDLWFLSSFDAVRGEDGEP